MICWVLLSDALSEGLHAHAQLAIGRRAAFTESVVDQRFECDPQANGIRRLSGEVDLRLLTGLPAHLPGCDDHCVCGVGSDAVDGGEPARAPAREVGDGADACSLQRLRGEPAHGDPRTEVVHVDVGQKRRGGIVDHGLCCGAHVSLEGGPRARSVGSCEQGVSDVGQLVRAQHRDSVGPCAERGGGRLTKVVGVERGVGVGTRPRVADVALDLRSVREGEMFPQIRGGPVPRGGVRSLTEEPTEEALRGGQRDRLREGAGDLLEPGIE